MKLHGLKGKKLKRKNTQELEEKIQREIIDRVFDRDSELKVKIQVQIKEQATIDALTELSNLPKEEIESIAREVRSRYEPAPEAEDKRPLVLRISGSAGVILIAVGLPLLAVVLPAVSSHIREKKEFEADKLIQAAEKGPVETVEFLLKNGGDINARGTRGRTALIAAVEKGDLEMARFLVSRGAKVDIKDADGKTALFKAVDTGSVELSRLLLENGGDVNTRISYTDDTPLLQAAYRNNVELMALLLEHGAKTESKRYGKDNCLEWAAMNGKAESVNFLMERGMTFKYAYDWVTDAMMLEAVKGRGEGLVLVLLGKGNKYDKKKDTRRWMSAQTKLVTDALKDAARCGIGEALRPLISSGADPNHPDTDYPLLRFVDHGDMTSVKYLLDSGADINALRRGHSCETPVVKAIINQNIGMVRLLIERGADLKIEICGYHKNALEWAYAAGGYSGTDEIYLLVRKACGNQK